MSIELKKGDHIHLMGICGTAMGSLAGLLQSQGFKITGSDQNVYPPMSTQLEKLGIKIMAGFKAENLSPAPKFVIVGNVISKSNPEAQALLSSNIPYTSLPKAMGEMIIKDSHSVVVSGTHGKTTTTSLCSWLAECAQKKPGFMVGGIPKNFLSSFRLSDSKWFVIEGDEYDTAFFDKVPKFVHYKPRSVILTSVEFDHADIYKDLDHVKSAFKTLLELIPTEGTLIYNGNDKNILDILPAAKSKTISYGFKNTDWTVENVKSVREGLEFTFLYKGKKEIDLFLPMFGKYNVLNALASYAMAKNLGWESDFKNSFKTFLGVKRRQELLGSPSGIMVIEDFAHHPTAVRETIQSFVDRKGPGRVFAIFEPRSATSRRKVFQQDYLQALSLADVVLMPKPFNQSNIDESDRFSSQDLVDNLSKNKINAHLFDGVDEIVNFAKQNAKANDIIVIMSNGGFDNIYQKMMTKLT